MSKRKQHEMQNRLYLGELVKTFLGPSRRIKCLEDEGGNRFFRYASLLLENLDIEHPVYMYIISVSHEFRKRFCAGAADNLLYYIHSWARIATDLNKMGIPLEDVIRDMRVTVNECIEHIDSKKMTISQSNDKFNQHNIKWSSCIDAGIMKGVTSIKGAIAIDLHEEENGHVIGELSMLRDKNDDIDFGNEVGKVLENYVESTVEMDHGLNQHIQGKANDNISFDTGNKIGNTSETEEDISGVNEDGIEFIHLKMKNIQPDDEDFDDTSWFFDDFEDDNVKGTDNGYNTMTDQNYGNEDQGIKTGVNGDDNNIVPDCEENSDDSGAIMNDIENLKRDIENDIKRLQDSRGKCLREKVNGSAIDMNKDEIGSDEFDSCFDDPDLEFDECVKDGQDTKNKGADAVGKSSENIVDHEEDDGFMTVALKFTDTKTRENKSKESSDYSQSLFYSSYIENCSNSRDEQTKGMKGSFDIELQTCSKEHVKIKEMLKDNSVNYGTVRNGEEELHISVVSEKELKDSLKSEAKLQSFDKNIVCSDCDKNDKIGEKLDISLSNKVGPMKQGKVSFHKDQMQKINSILGSLGKESKKDGSKVKVSSLKFHSRHFQGEEIEEQCETDNSKVDKDTEQLNNDVNNETNDNRSKTDCENISTSRNPRTLNQTSESSMDKLCYDSLPDSPLFSKKLVSKVELNPQTLDLKNINNMLRDINGLTKRNIDSSRINLETTFPQCKMEIDTDFTQITKKDCKSNSENFEIKHMKPKFDILSIGKELSLKGGTCKTGMVNKPNVFLRSRHMNTETEDDSVSQVIPNGASPKSESEEVKHISDNGSNSKDDDDDNDDVTEEKNESVEEKKVPEDGNISKGHYGDDVEEMNECEEKTPVTDNVINDPYDHIEELAADTRSLVFGVNHDGDEDINKAVCDIILKQSKEGKLRLNIDLVDCHSSIGASRGSHEVIDGVVVQNSVERMMMVQRFPQRQYRALLVNGDLTMTFRHKGYKPLKAKQFTSLERFESGNTDLNSWQNDIIDVLKELCVDMLLVKGNISDSIASMCEEHDIVTMETVPYKQLVQLSEATETDMLTYVTLATEENICTGITISPLRKSWCNGNTQSWRDKVDAVISLTENNPQTVILYGASTVLVNLKEQEMWNSLQLISSVLHCGYLVKGAGQTEEDCVKFLNDKADIIRRDGNSVSSPKTQMKQVVTESMMSSFRDYSRLYHDNFMEERYVLEGYKCKIETWKLAMETVAIVTNIDSYIITGLTEEEANNGTL